MKRYSPALGLCAALLTVPTAAYAYPVPGPRPCDPPRTFPTVYEHMTAPVPGDPTQTTRWWRTRTKTVTVCRIWDHDGKLWLRTRWKIVSWTAWTPRYVVEPVREGTERGAR